MIQPYNFDLPFYQTRIGNYCYIKDYVNIADKNIKKRKFVPMVAIKGEWGCFFYGTHRNLTPLLFSTRALKFESKIGHKIRQIEH